MLNYVNHRYDKESQKDWFPYSISTRPDDFVIQNGVHGRCPNVVCDDKCHHDDPKYWQNLKISDFIDNSPEIGCFGCSFTYGSFLQEDATWPYLLQQSLQRSTGNFGVPGGGADACLTNIINAYDQFKIKIAIVLFPVMHRRLLKFQSKGFYFQMPIGPHSSWPFDEFVAQNYFGQSFIIEKIEQVKRQISSDSEQTYSKEKINNIKDFCEEKSIVLYTSSWDQHTRHFLIHNNFKVLPLYDIKVSQRRAGDDEHPCEAHNIDWVSKIATSIL